MQNPWLALPAGADPRERIGQNGRAWDAFLGGGRVGGQVREVVADSWRRSAAGGLDPDAAVPIGLDDDGPRQRLLARGPEGVRFLIRSRLLTPQELAELDGQPA
ncbi:MAG TPA: hypothetical protein VL738_28380 [Dactylosporangium sp.]|jgi:hypothetical protein|nr:hypothetical protein [Dactylosporangium sp.]